MHLSEGLDLYTSTCSSAFILHESKRSDTFTCQLPLLRCHLACSMNHGNTAKVAISDAHEEREDARPCRVAEGGLLSGIHTQDEQRDENYSHTGEEEKTSSVPFIRYGCQDLHTRTGEIRHQMISENVQNTNTRLCHHVYEHTLPTKSDMLKMAMIRMGSHSPIVTFLISDSSPGKRHNVMK